MSQNSRRLFWADLFARVTFSLASGMFIEIVLSGMTLKQSLLSRATNLPLVMLMARPYGIYRDWALKKFGATKTETPIRWGAINMVTYATFFVPQYAFVLWVEGATPLQIAKASGSVALFSLVLGILYGYWLDLCRFKIFRIDPERIKDMLAWLRRRKTRSPLSPI